MTTRVKELEHNKTVPTSASANGQHSIARHLIVGRLGEYSTVCVIGCVVVSQLVIADQSLFNEVIANQSLIQSVFNEVIDDPSLI